MTHIMTPDRHTLDDSSPAGARMKATILSSNNSDLMCDIFDIEGNELMEEYYGMEYLDACNILLMNTLQSSSKHQNQRFYYLSQSYNRCQRLLAPKSHTDNEKQKDAGSLSSDEHRELIVGTKELIIDSAALVLQQQSLFSKTYDTHAKQFITWITNVIDHASTVDKDNGTIISSQSSSNATPSASAASSGTSQPSPSTTTQQRDVDIGNVIQFIRDIVKRIPPLELKYAVQPIFLQLQNDMKLCTFTRPSYATPLIVLYTLLQSSSKVAEVFVTTDTFINSWINGYRIELESSLGIFFRLTTLPDQNSEMTVISDRYFSSPMSMTDVEKMFVIQRLRRKLEKSHDILTDVLLTLLSLRNTATISQASPSAVATLLERDKLTRKAVLAWFATLLLGNWSRNRLRQQRKSTSNDGFLLNVATVALRVGRLVHIWGMNNYSHIDSFFSLLPSRLDLQDETKIAASSSEQQNFLIELHDQLHRNNQPSATDTSLSHTDDFPLTPSKFNSPAKLLQQIQSPAARQRTSSTKIITDLPTVKESNTSISPLPTSSITASASFAYSPSPSPPPSYSTAAAGVASSGSPSASSSSAYLHPPLPTPSRYSHSRHGHVPTRHPLSPIPSDYENFSSASAPAQSVSLLEPASPIQFSQPSTTLPIPMVATLPAVESVGTPSASTSLQSQPSTPPSATPSVSQSNAGNRRRSLSNAAHMELTRYRLASRNAGIGMDERADNRLDNLYLIKSMSQGHPSAPTHHGVVCDRCRTNDFKGVRYKCVCCRDYDVCSSCEWQEHLSTLNISSSSSRNNHDTHNDVGAAIPPIHYECCYSDCEAEPMSEQELIRHITRYHSSSNQIVSCPICAANGMDTMLQNPRFTDHLSKQHDNKHDPLTHVYIKIDKTIPQFHRRIFHRIPTIERDVAANHIRMDIDADNNNNTNSNKSITASTHQQRDVHDNATCTHCGISPIKGVLYICFNCTNYFLCTQCEGKGFKHHGHDQAHTFAKIRHPITDDSMNILSHTAAPTLFPNAVRGSFGFNFSTEWYMMTMHLLHMGMIKTCIRYTSLVHSYETEQQEPRRLESLAKVKHVVEAQLLQARLLQDTLQIYGFTAGWLKSLIDPEGRGLPLPSLVPMNYAALPEYYVEDMADFVLFICHHAVYIIDSEENKASSLPLIKSIVYLFVMLIASPLYLNNPYLRAKLVEVLCALCKFNTSHGSGSVVGDQIMQSDEFVVLHLLPSLVKLYNDVEASGTDATAFYDKFNVRHAIAVLMRFLIDPTAVQLAQAQLQAQTPRALSSDGGSVIRKLRPGRKSNSADDLQGKQPETAHVKVLEELCARSGDMVVKFINNVISDLAFLIDESLQKASQILEQQQNAAASAANRDRDSASPASASTSTMTATVSGGTLRIFSSGRAGTGAGSEIQLRRAGSSGVESESTNMSRSLRTSSVLASHTLNLLSTLTQNARFNATILEKHELIDRITNTINQYIIRIAGDNRKELSTPLPTTSSTASSASTSAPSQTQYNPDIWLAVFIDIYCRFRHSSHFFSHVVQNSFSMSAYKNALDIINRKQLKRSASPADVEQLTELLNEVVKHQQNELASMGEIPEQFLDPVTASLMEDPVKLPNGVIMDRHVIVRHLATSATNPFSREPLTVDQLVPATELKESIDAFKLKAKMTAIAMMESHADH